MESKNHTFLILLDLFGKEYGFEQKGKECLDLFTIISPFTSHRLCSSLMELP